MVSYNFTISLLYFNYPPIKPIQLYSQHILSHFYHPSQKIINSFINSDFFSNFQFGNANSWLKSAPEVELTASNFKMDWSYLYYSCRLPDRLRKMPTISGTSQIGSRATRIPIYSTTSTDDKLSGFILLACPSFASTLLIQIVNFFFYCLSHFLDGV